MSAAPRCWASAVSQAIWTFFRYSLTSLKPEGSVTFKLLLRSLYSWWMRNTGSVRLWSVRMAGSLQVASWFWVEIHVSVWWLRWRIETHTGAGNNGKHWEHSCYRVFLLCGQVVLKPGANGVMKNDGGGQRSDRWHSNLVKWQWGLKKIFWVLTKNCITFCYEIHLTMPWISPGNSWMQIQLKLWLMCMCHIQVPCD